MHPAMCLFTLFSLCWTRVDVRTGNAGPDAIWCANGYRSRKLDDFPNAMVYSELDSEPGYSTDIYPSESWPGEGSFAIENLSLAYFEGGPQILRDINVRISNKEKVGVVGRTGAGKSSLVSALFRMPDPLGKVSELLEAMNVGVLETTHAWMFNG